jgi:hypothetical protein
MIVSRIRMPLFTYALVVAPALLGLLYAAEAVMGPPGAMPLASEAPVLAKRESARADAVQVLTVSEPVAVPASALAWNETIRSPEPQRQAAVQTEEPAPVAAAEPAALAPPVAAAQPATTDGRAVADGRAAGEPRKKVAAVKKKKPVRVARERHDVYAYEPRQRSFFNIW